MNNSPPKPKNWHKRVNRLFEVVHSGLSHFGHALYLFPTHLKSLVRIGWRTTKKICKPLIHLLAHYPVTFYIGLIALAFTALLLYLHFVLGWQFYPHQLWLWMSRHATQILIFCLGSLGVILTTSAIAFRGIKGMSKQEHRLYNHQKSTRTLIPFLLPLHDWLRLNSRFYRWWHNKHHAGQINVLMLIIFLISFGFFMNKNVLQAEASDCSDEVNITSDTSWTTTPQCHGNVTVTNGATLTITGGVVVDVDNLTLGDGSTNGFITANGDTVNDVGVTFTISENLEIKSGSSISANSKGDAARAGTGAGSGRSGGAYGGNGGSSSTSGTPGAAYGSITNPSAIGSGGGDDGCCGASGGIGGGAVVMTVTGTTTLNGSITANGGNGNSGGAGGSGGTVNITTGTLAGSSGSVTANGGTGGGGGGGGGGRIAIIYTTDSYTSGISSLTKTAYGGTPGDGGSNYGGAGTIYLKAASQTNGDLIIDNNSNWASGTAKTPTMTTPVTFDSVTLRNKGNLWVKSGHTLTATAFTINTNGVLTEEGTFNWPDNSSITLPNASRYELIRNRTFTTLTISSGGILTHPVNTTAETYKLQFSATTLTIDSGGKIEVDSLGYSDGSGSGTGSQGGSSTSGGGYGGNGGLAGGTAGSAYGSIVNPVNIGSGGGDANCCGAVGGKGGGAVIATISGTTTLNGSITANGGNGTGGAGGGSGGTVNLTTGTLSGSTGSVTANGGSGHAGGGSGGGGRIAITYTTDSYTSGITSLTATAYGGASSPYGGAGSIYLKPTGGNGKLIYKNNDLNGAKSDISSSSADFASVTFGDITISKAAKPNIAGNITLNSDGAVTLSDSNTILYIDGANKTSNTGGVGVVMTAASLTVNTNTTINADGNGYSATFGEGRATGNSGGGHGGAGATGTTGAGGTTYGSLSNPVILGSGGGTSGGAGGGAFKITTTGAITVNGTVTANGAASANGAGSGGSIGMFAGGAFNVTSGIIRANGGAGSSNGGGGGGGRVAATFTSKSWSGQTVTASAGANGTGAAAGTTYIPPVTPTHSSPSGVTSTNITWNWTDNSDTENNFRVYNAADDSLVTTITSTTEGTTGTAYTYSETVIPGTQYARYIKAYDSDLTVESGATSTQTIYSLANVPNSLNLSSAATTSESLTWGQNSNASGVEYAIGYDNDDNGSIDSNGWVQTGGGIGGASETWKTYSAWGAGSGLSITGLSVNTTYIFKVKARNGTPTETALSSGASLASLANAPGALTITTPQNTSSDTLYYVNSSSIKVKVQQNSNPSTTQYAISVTRTAPTPADTEKFAQTPNGSFESTLDSSAVWKTYAQWNSTTGVTITGLEANNTYSVKVKARNADNVETAYGGAASVTTPLAPVPPTAVSISDASNTSDETGDLYRLQIDWTAVDNLLLDYYIVERSTDGSSFSQLATTTNRYYLDTTVGQGTTYYYRIKSHTSVPDTSSASTTVSKVPAEADTTDPTISSVEASVVNSTEADITWVTDENATSSVSYGTTTSYGSTASDSTLSSASKRRHVVKLSGLTPGTVYHYKVTSEDGSSNSADSSDATFTTDEATTSTDGTAPTVSSVSVGTPTNNSVTITWTSNESGSSFVEYATTESAVTAGNATAQGKDGSVTSHTVTLSGLSANTTYYYRAKTKDSSGNSGVSSVASFTTSRTPNASTTGISALSLKGTKVKDSITTEADVDWLSDIDTTSFVEYGLTTSYGSVGGKEEFTKVHSVTLSGLQPDTLYHYRVNSRDANGNVYVSEDKTFKTGFTSAARSISDVRIEDITLTSATILWKTNSTATTQVLYGTSESNLSERTNEVTDADTNHVVKLTGLTQGTKYFFQVRGKDSSSSDVIVSVPFTFATVSQPRFTNFSLDSVSDNKIVIKSALNDAPDTLLVEYANNPNFDDAQSQGISGTPQKDNAITITGLSADTTYYLRGVAKNKFGDSTTSSGVSAKTESDVFAPQITSIKAETSTVGTGEAAVSQMIVAVDTDEPVTVEVQYRVGGGSGYPKSVKGSDNASAKQYVAIQSLSPATTVHYIVIAKDIKGNVTTSQDQTALTPVAQTSVAQVILNALSQTFGPILKLFNNAP